MMLEGVISFSEGQPMTEERDSSRENSGDGESNSILEKLKSGAGASSEGSMAPLPADDPDLWSQSARMRATTYSMTKEKLLLTYRYMKSRLAEQPSPPTIIHIPPGVIYRRFGFGIALGKLLKVYFSNPFHMIDPIILLQSIRFTLPCRPSSLQVFFVPRDYFIFSLKLFPLTMLDCKFGGDFFFEFLEVLKNVPVSGLVFRNRHVPLRIS